jgi:hypothetical protein
MRGTGDEVGATRDEGESRNEVKETKDKGDKI